MRTRSRTRLLLAAAPAVALACIAPAGGAEWTALVTPHFRVLSQVSESRSREIIRRLDIYMQALPALTNLPVKPSPVPTEVFLLDAADFGPVRCFSASQDARHPIP